jgi:hypothetical protein
MESVSNAQKQNEKIPEKNFHAADQKNQIEGQNCMKSKILPSFCDENVSSIEEKKSE